MTTIYRDTTADGHRLTITQERTEFLVWFDGAMQGAYATRNQALAHCIAVMKGATSDGTDTE